MRNSSQYLKVFVLLSTFLFSSNVSWAQEEAEKDSKEVPGIKRCLSLVSIKDTRILDDKNIIYYGMGKKIYRNHLPRRCPGLRPSSTYLHKPILGQVCSLDFITVIDGFSSHFFRGASCSLGKFEPITKEQLEALKEEIATAKEKKSEQKS